MTTGLMSATKVRHDDGPHVRHQGALGGACRRGAAGRSGEPPMTRNTATRCRWPRAAPIRLHRKTEANDPPNALLAKCGIVDKVLSWYGRCNRERPAQRPSKDRPPSCSPPRVIVCFASSSCPSHLVRVFISESPSPSRLLRTICGRGSPGGLQSGRNVAFFRRRKGGGRAQGGVRRSRAVSAGPLCRGMHRAVCSSCRAWGMC